MIPYHLAAAGENHPLHACSFGCLEDPVDADDIGPKQFPDWIVDIVGCRGEMDQRRYAGKGKPAGGRIADVADDAIGQPRRRHTVETAHGMTAGGQLADDGLPDVAGGTGDEDGGMSHAKAFLRIGARSVCRFVEDREPWAP